MTFSPTWAAALFMPATAGLLYQAVQPHPWPYRLLALALMLMSLEQAHMARVDLRQGEMVGQRSRDPRLGHFARVVGLAIAGQVAGFSIAALGHLGWGMGLILVSLLGFNLAATIRLEPASPRPIQAAGWRSRLDVLALDAIALGLALLWIAQRAQGWVAGGLFAITVVYGSSKLATYAAALRSSSAAGSAIHIPHAAQEHPQTSQQN
ncbi:hypothetical protein PGN35_005355 [Nodosilinea sp. PGN35]|uniref:hypothetical protein n=1 Tax=Nodosilinea sp. PGN35 TaxID=3020489 RepID=UPI0023B33692|nr:hypothetical protein [Nodosilinea sp. TSF1-S3]MDF0367665.1 hypothetical protein [Nodosilinea sp. TSF1-S3]